MNTVVTSKEAILEVSRTLIMEQGWTSINIRSVASKCGVAVGSIYNYFSSKSELVEATIESVWCDIFHISEGEDIFHSFADCIEWLYKSMEKGDKKYPGFFTLHSIGFLGEEKARGRQLMKQSWEHIQDRLYTVLINDKNVRPEAFNERFTPKKFVELVFSLIISALVRQDYDCCAVIEVVRRSIYE